MKVSELKQILDELDQDIIVYLNCEEGRYPLQFDEINKIKINESEVFLIG